jgi:hypothetical protein
VLQVAILDCGAFDLFSLFQDLAASSVNIGGSEIAQALLISMMIISCSTKSAIRLRDRREITVFQHDAERRMPALDLEVFSDDRHVARETCSMGLFSRSGD